MSLNKYDLGKKLAEQLAKYKVPSSQIYALLQAFSQDEKYVKVLIKERAHRGFLPPPVAKYLLSEIPENMLKDVLIIASKLVDYEYLKPLVEDWDDFRKYLENTGIVFDIEDINKVEVLRSRDRLVLRIYTGNKRLYSQANRIAYVYSKYLADKYGINIRVKIKIVGE